MLIRYELPGYEQVTNWRELFIDYLSQISADVFCASWMDEIEFQTWRALNGGPFYPTIDEEIWDPYCFPEEMKKDLRFLLKKVNGWVHYDSPNCLVSLEKWDKLYKEWSENG
jgi:hypothetical protein